MIGKKEKSVGTGSSLDPDTNDETIIGSTSSTSSPPGLFKDLNRQNMARIENKVQAKVHVKSRSLTRQESEFSPAEPVFQWKLSSPPPKRFLPPSRGNTIKQRKLNLIVSTLFIYIIVQKSETTY